MKITKETLRRSIRTFAQSALAYIMVNAVYINFTGDKITKKSSILALLVSALAAGISAAMNLERVDEIEER